MAINRTRKYNVEPHENPELGFVGIERVNGKVTWRSCNHCDESLCHTEISQRKQRLQEVQRFDDKRRKWKR